MDNPEKNSKKNTLSWLHLADLFFTVNHNSVNFNLMLNDIEAQLQTAGVRPDFIAVTGDVAFSGQSVEYDIARSSFDNLLKRVGIGKGNGVKSTIDP